MALLRPNGWLHTVLHPRTPLAILQVLSAIADALLQPLVNLLRRIICVNLLFKEVCFCLQVRSRAGGYRL